MKHIEYEEDAGALDSNLVKRDEDGAPDVLIKPSNAYKWTAGGTLESLKPEELTLQEKRNSIRGNLSHELIQLKLELLLNAKTISEKYKLLRQIQLIKEHKFWNSKMDKQTEDCLVDTFRILKTAQKEFKCKINYGIEELVDLSFIEEGLNGKPDFFFYTAKKHGKNTLTVIDYKFGKKRVRAEKNPQLMLYALGIAKKVEEEGLGRVGVCHLYIDQPSRSNKPDKWSLDAGVLEDWVETRVKPSLKELKSGTNTV